MDIVPREADHIVTMADRDNNVPEDFRYKSSIILTASEAKLSGQIPITKRIKSDFVTGTNWIKFKTVIIIGKIEIKIKSAACAAKALTKSCLILYRNCWVIRISLPMG